MSVKCSLLRLCTAKHFTGKMPFIYYYNFQTFDTGITQCKQNTCERKLYPSMHKVELS